MYKLVLLRHGESLWNKTNRFTGWVDVELSEKGVKEAIAAGNALKEAGYNFDIAYTSLLKRAIKTLWLTLEQMDLMWIPVVNSWYLNERHYGALQGLNKAETAAEHGEEQVLIWRRSYDTPPPELKSTDEQHPSKDIKYSSIKSSDLPLTESLKDTVARFVPYWEKTIAPVIKSGQKVLIVAHGNSLRALVKYLDNVSESNIIDLNIPTGVPLVYELDENLQTKGSRFLGDQAAIEQAMAQVASQGKAAK